jgi:acyl-CoA dehydrogenase family protein 9
MQKNSSIIKSLYLGNIIEENLFPFPTISKSEQETVQMVVETVTKFLSEKTEEIVKFDRQGFQSDEYIETLKELGLFGLIIPEEFNGLGLSSAGYARVIQQTSKFDGATAITIGAHSSIGMKGLLLFGNDAQKKKYLPKLASGEMVAAFCLTEPGAGSDAASIKTNAVQNADGTWTLNGEKIWISNGAFAEFFTVFARTDSDKGKMTAFIVERSMAGVSNGPKEDKMGIRGSATTTVSFQDVKVPAENILGEVGHGFKIAMSILNNGRTGLGGGCIGALKACIENATKQSLQRKQFGRSISEFGLIQEKIAQMTVDCFVTESAVGILAHLIDSGCDDYSAEAAATKVFASEALWRGANEALQIAGGNGFMKEYPYERVVRDSRINMIFEGTNEILRLFIALSGMKDAGSYLKELGKAVGQVFNDPIKGFGVMSDYATKKLSALTGMGTEKLAVEAPLRDMAKILELGTLGLNKTVEQVLKQYKKEIIGEQFISKRVADVSIDLFVGLSTLSRVDAMVKSQGIDKSKHAVDILKIFTQQAKYRIKANLAGVNRVEDDTMKSLAKHICDKGQYDWDLL